MIQSTRGMSKPRAATSVQRRIPEEALQNSKKVLVRFCCFCLPCVSNSVCELIVDLLAEQEEEEEETHMEIQYRHIDIIQQLSMILDTITTRKEDYNLLLHMFLQKREQQQEPSVARAYDVSLR